MPRFSLDRPLLPFLLCSAIGFLIYSGTLQFSFQWDDIPNIVENRDIQSLEVLKDFSAPRYVGIGTFALNYYLGGMDVAGYHLVNLLIHVINGFLAYSLILSLSLALSRDESQPFDGLGGDSSRWTSWLAMASALWFLSHPVQTQAVTYIVQRFTSLATLFYLLAVLGFLRWRMGTESKTRSVVPGSHQGWFAVSLGATILAMKTKEISFTIPFVLILTDLLFFQKSRRRKWPAWIPFLLTLGIIPISHMGLLHLGQGLPNEAPHIDRFHYFMTQLSVLVVYLRLLVFPVRQNLDYDYLISQSFLEPRVLFSALLLGLLLGLAVYLALIRAKPVYMRQSRTMERVIFWPSELKLMGYGILWFFLTLSVESSFIPLDDVIFEHRLYLPSIGGLWCILIGMMGMARWIAHRIGWRKLDDLIHSQAAYGWLCLIPTIILAILAYQRNQIWENPYTLWSDVVNKSPQKSRPHLNLGVALFEASGSSTEAIYEFQTAIDLNPGLPEAHFNLARVYSEMGRQDEAIRSYRLALRLRPDYPKAHNNLGILFRNRGQWEEAIREVRAAIGQDPGNFEYQNNLGNLLSESGRTEEAVEAYRKALARGGELPEIHQNLGLAYFSSGKFDQAIDQFQKAIKKDPLARDAYYNLGVALEQKEDWSGAKRGYEAALRLDPRDGRAQDRLAGIYFHLEDLERAREEYERAIALDPGNSWAHYHLGRIHERLGAENRARSHFSMALSIDPDLEEATMALDRLSPEE